MKTYPISEHFFSLQGEGANVGKPAYFLRLSGCNVRCSFCDSKNSWDDANAQNMSLKEIVHLVKKSGAKNVVITGGEPLLHDLDELCEMLRTHIPNISLWLETSGTAPFRGGFDWVCLSPKKHKLPLFENYEKADELKVIIENSDDFEFAEQQAQQVNSNCKLFLQGEWSNMGAARNARTIHTTAIIDYILQNPKWRLSVQVHKFLGIL
ncbi:MAG: 7-carboxy-7-deazaguanine synthase QueE [Bacteroidales bacterium]|jgi:organic radical activating enzyme|nr:7-carboxy-7-deazaguanine synthase QueE [Bacteroidales bacterium]